MARVKGALATRKRRNKTLKLAKGYWGGKQTVQNRQRSGDEERSVCLYRQKT